MANNTSQENQYSPFLIEDEYQDAYHDSQKYMRFFFEPFDEFERLASNKVRADLPEGFPSVNDGTLSAMLKEIPMEILGQMVTGRVNVESVYDPILKQMVPAPPWLKELANIIWEKKIIPHATTDATFYIKWVVALYRAIKYGSQPIYDFYTVKNGYKGVDMSLPYIKDVYFEANKVSCESSDYVFMDSYYSKLKIRRIISLAEDMAKKGIQTPWIVKNLKTIYDSATESEKDQRSKNQQERDKGITQNGIKFTTIFQRGKGAPFCTFYSGIGADGGKNSNALLTVRETTNRNPIGDIPVHNLYAFQDLENPLGRGKVEDAGGTQNVLDYVTQADVLATQIGLQPPIEIAGDRERTDLNSLLWAPNRFWFTGDAKVSPMRNETPIYTQFPTRFGLYKSQLLNTLAKTDAAVGADAGNPGFSKTDAGVKFQASRSGTAENFLRQMFNQTYNAVASHMLNEHFANMQGTDVMQVSQEHAEKLMALGLIDEDPNTPDIPSTDQIEVIWNNLRGEFEFDVDPESSMVKNDSDQAQSLMEALKVAGENPNLNAQLQAAGVQFNIGEAYKQLFNRLGLQDVEKIIVPLPKDAMGAQPGLPGAVDPATGQPVQQPPQDPNAQPPNANAIDSAVPSGTIPANGETALAVQPEQQAGDLPPELQQAIAETMQQYGVDQRAAMAIVHARSMNIPEEYIAQYLKTGNLITA